jgi:hypothetical protein
MSQSLHVRSARTDFGGGIIRSPRPKKSYETISHDIIRNVNLSYTAIGLLIRLLSNEDNVSQTADDLLREKKTNGRQRRGNGRRSILAALAELRLEGYLQTFILHGDGGLHHTVSIVFDQPQPVPEGWRATLTGVLHPVDPATCVLDERSQVIEKTGVRIPASGIPASGMRTPLKIPRAVPKEKSSSTRATRVPAPADAGAAAANSPPEATEKAKENKAFRIVHGVHCWTPDDVAGTQALDELHGVDTVQAAANILHNQGVAPVPGRVAQELQRRVSAAAAAEAAARADARLARIDQESKARAERDMAELLARRANETSQERDP